MITISPSKDEELALKVKEFDGYICGNQSKGWLVSENMQLAGYLLFDVGCLSITRLSCENEQLADGLIKSAALFAYNISAEKLFCIDIRPKVKQALLAAGFIDSSAGKMEIDPENIKRTCTHE